MHKGVGGLASVLSATAVACALATSGTRATDDGGAADAGASRADAATLDGAVAADDGAAPPDAESPDARAPLVLAPGLNDPVALALDATDVYWTLRGSSPSYLDGAVMRAAKDGSSAPRVIVTADSQALRAPLGIAVQNGLVYFACTIGGSLVRAGIDGSALTVLLGSQAGPAGIAVDATFVFWTNINDTSNAIMRAALDGSGKTAISDEPKQPYPVAIDATYVYWAALGDNSVKRNKRDGTGKAEVVVAPRGPFASTMSIALDDTYLYSTNADDGHLTRVDKTVITNVAVLASQPHALALAVDATDVYWVTYEASGDVWRTHKDGSGSERIAMGQSWPYAIAVDDARVYWVNRGTQTAAAGDLHDAKDGQLMRLSK